MVLFSSLIYIFFSTVNYREKFDRCNNTTKFFFSAKHDSEILESLN